MVEILQFVHDIRSCAEVLYKGVLKNFLKFTEKKKKQSSGGALLKDVLKSLAKFKEKHLCQSFSPEKRDLAPGTLWDPSPETQDLGPETLYVGAGTQYLYHYYKFLLMCSVVA